MTELEPRARYTPPPWPDIFDFVDDVLAATSSDVVLPPSPIGMPFEIAFAAAARNRRLLAGVISLIRAGLPDVIGGLIRSIYETWLVGSYALLGAPESLDRLLAHQDLHLKPILAVVGKESEEQGSQLQTRTLAEMTSQLMVQHGLPNPQYPLDAYEVVFRWESYRNTHGGLGAVEGYILRGDEGVTIIRARQEGDDSVRHRVLVATAIFLSSTQIPAIEAGLDHSQLDSLADRLFAFEPAHVVPDR